MRTTFDTLYQKCIRFMIKRIHYYIKFDIFYIIYFSVVYILHFNINIRRVNHYD